MIFFLKSNTPCQTPLKLTIEPEANLFDSLTREISSKLNLDTNEFYLSTNHGTKLNRTSILTDQDTFQICPCVLGGKGGFGSLLRAFGKQITMSTNKEVSF